MLPSLNNLMKHIHLQNEILSLREVPYTYNNITHAPNKRNPFKNKFSLLNMNSELWKAVTYGNLCICLIFQNLSDNKLGSEGAVAIKKMLTGNSSIRKLEIAGVFTFVP